MRYILFVLFLLFGFVNAQSEVIVQSGTKFQSGTIAIQQALDMSKANTDKVNNVSFAFCDSGFNSVLNLSLRPNQKKNICVIFVNNSDEILSLDVNLVSASFDSNGNIVCGNGNNLSTGIVSDFSVFSGILTLAPNQQFVNYFSLSADTLIQSGSYYACLVYNLPRNNNLKTNGPFNLIIRKSGYITLNVSGEKYYFNWWDDIVFWTKRHMSQISLGGIIVFAVLMGYTLFAPNKKNTKKHSAKK